MTENFDREGAPTRSADSGREVAVGSQPFEGGVRLSVQPQAQTAEATTAELLAELQKPEEEGQQGRDTVVIIHKDAEVRAAVKEILTSIFPGYEMAEFEGEGAAAKAISENLRDRVAMVFNLEPALQRICRDKEGKFVVKSSRFTPDGTEVSSSDSQPFSKVPIVEQLNPAATGLASFLQKGLLKSGGIDAALTLPFERRQLEEALRDVIRDLGEK